ncbi:uncharacterized protein CDAR_180291 [Caerostris darwini]|uniref:Uncharacterized protein n=1 Tax=Caerostris darwini TaxID=1538125 RepID=A0AAV4PFY2_9ARAC|nr:uncharacterized protein CDAR_180291 [Caerostris darwini]
MESSADGDCPTGILIDFDVQTKDGSKTSKNREIKQINVNEKEISSDIKTSELWILNNIMDQSPIYSERKMPFERKMVCSTKSKLSTPSPKSMRIISSEASRIVDQLHASPVNYSEVMLCDEVFPSINSLDEDCLDEFHMKSSKSLPVIDNNFTLKKTIDTNSSLANKNVPKFIFKAELSTLDLSKCTISPSEKGNLLDENVIIPEENRFIYSQKSKIMLKTNHDPSSENTKECSLSFITKNENDSQTSIESNLKHGNADEKTRSNISMVKKNSKDSDCINIVDEIAPKSTVVKHTKMPSRAFKSFGFKSSIKSTENNKENVLLCTESNILPARYGSQLSETEKSSIGDAAKESKIINCKSIKKFITEHSFKKCVSPSKLISGKRRDKSISNLNKEKKIIEKPGVLLQKPNVERQSLSCKKQPLFKSASMRETPNTIKLARRTNSFQVGIKKNSIPITEMKPVRTIGSCSKVLKPKMSLNQTLGNELSTPMKYGSNSQRFKAITNQKPQMSQAFRPNCSFGFSNIKTLAPKDEHSILKKPAVTTSSKLRFVSRLDLPSTLPKHMNDNLPRKLFSDCNEDMV